jgi:hypothetical protein
MKEWSTNMKTLMARDTIGSALFVTIGPSSGVYATTYNFTSLHYDYPINFGFFSITYLANNGLYAVDAPRISETVDKEAYKVIITDPDYTLRAYMDNGAFTGAGFHVFGMLINITGSAELGAAPGQPYIDTLSVLYSGYVDQCTYSITPDESTLLEISGASPMGDLDGTRSIITSKAAMQQRTLGDQSYDQVLVGSGGLTLKWGKEK